MLVITGRIYLVVKLIEQKFNFFFCPCVKAVEKKSNKISFTYYELLININKINRFNKDLILSNFEIRYVASLTETCINLLSS